MPRNSSGNYTLPAGNPVVAGTIIDVDWANPTMQDIAVQLNNVLTRDGLLGPISPLLAVDGTVGLPGLSFAANPTTGLYNSATGAGFAYLGVLFWFANASGVRIAKPLILGNPTAPGTPLADGDLNVEGKIYINGVEFNIYSLLSSPPPIGDVVPNTGAFTTLKAGGADVVTLTAVQTLLNKTLTTPVLANPSYSGTTANGGTVTTIDINGGTIDATAIGSTTPAAGSFTTVTASSPITLTAANPYVSFVGTAASQQWGIGDGLNATNGNLVVYDYTGSIKALEITKATGAVTIPGSLTSESVTITGGSYAVGKIYYEVAGGIVVGGKTGSISDLVLCNGTGRNAVEILAGTTPTVKIPGSLSVTGASSFTTGSSSTATNPFDTPNVILKTVNSTVGNYSAIQNYNYGGGANAAILFVNDGQSAYPNNGGSIAFATYAGGGAGGTVKMTLSAAGNLSINAGTLGYGTGAGGTVTQATSKSTAVTLNKACGQITMNNAALAAGATVLFQVTNSLALSSSIVVVNANHNPAGEFYSVWCSHSFAGGFFVCIRNITAVPLSDALVLNFALLTGATS